MPDTADPVSTAVPPGALTRLLREALRSASADGREALPALRPGQVVGRFEIVRQIGRGGFGVVYEARDRELGRAVALKAVRMGGDLELKEERLLREAEAAAQLSHPNIVTLHDLGRFEGRPYLVMELLRGENLWHRLAAGPVRAAEALRIGTEIAKAIAHAHAHGVVHRDLTPGNVFLCTDGQVKVLDFGLAQAFGRRKVEGGTRDYMAPEQLRGDPEDERTDVFSLGVMLHQMLFGTVPSAQARDGDGAAPRVPPSTEPALAGLVSRMLDGDPARRPRDGGAVLAALAERARTIESREDRGRSSRATRAAVLVAAAAVLVAAAIGASRSRTATVEAAAGAAPATRPEPATAASARAVPIPDPAPASRGAGDAPPRQAAALRPSAPTAPGDASARRRGLSECRDRINALPTPDATSGDGVLTVEADPFGEVSVNGRRYGETPRECRAAADTYTVRAVHPAYGVREARVTVRPGERTRWTADFLDR